MREDVSSAHSACDKLPFSHMTSEDDIVMDENGIPGGTQNLMYGGRMRMRFLIPHRLLPEGVVLNNTC